MPFSKPSTTNFQPSYIKEFPWIKEDPNSRTSAICTWCRASINILSMGKTALTSHAKSLKHSSNEKNRQKCLNVGMFLTRQSDKQNLMPSAACANATIETPTVSNESTVLPSAVPSSSSEKKCTQPKALKSFLLSESVTKSEIFWTLQIVLNHISFRTAAKLAAGFGMQFPDSEIAGKIQLQRTKVGYTILFGLAPYFQRQLETLLEDATNIVVCFDEALNKVSQKQQMDIHLRFCYKSRVETRYFSSIFLGSSKAVDLFDAIISALPAAYLQKVIQISMDGPNVNLKLLSHIEAHLKETPDSPELVNIGTCGLHTLHNAFKVGITSTGWEIITFLRALYNLFKNSPARRAEYTHCTGSKIFPLQFCAVRWVESGPVAERAVKIMPNVIKYVKEVTKEPNSYSFRTVKEKINDNLLTPKLAFFSSVAGLVEPFLREFQGDQPMAPFLYQELNSLLLSLMERVVREDVLKKVKNQVEKIDLTNENLKPAKNIDIGFATRDALRNSTSDNTHLSVLTFRQDCRTAFVSMIKKIMEKSPLHYKMTKYISCLDPSVTGYDTKLAQIRLNHCLETLVAKHLMSGSKADSVKRQFNEVFTSPGVIEQCKNFKRNESRLDNFWFEIIKMSGGSDKYQNLYDFCTTILTLSHGNSTVERGFSINSECIVENLKQESLIALRQVYDGVHAVGPLEDFVISKELIHAARNAHSLYSDYLKKREKDISDEERTEKLKRKAALEQKELEAKKARIIDEARKQAALIDDKISSLKKL